MVGYCVSFESVIISLIILLTGFLVAAAYDIYSDCDDDRGDL